MTSLFRLEFSFIGNLTLRSFSTLWELRRATDLALRATKHTARAVGRSMAASVAAERHLWLNLTEIREKEKVFLMDAPISQSRLFGEAVSAVVDKPAASANPGRS